MFFILSELRSLKGLSNGLLLGLMYIAFIFRTFFGVYCLTCSFTKSVTSGAIDTVNSGQLQCNLSAFAL